MSLYCTICRYPTPDGVNQCTNCRNGFLPQLACSTCGQMVMRGEASCFRCGRGRPGTTIADMEESPPNQGMGNLAVSPPSFSVRNIVAAPPVLPGLPAHVTAMPAMPERYRVARHGVVADIRTPAGDIDVMQMMSNTVVVLHTLAAKMGERSIVGDTSTSTEVVTLMGQGVVILHALAGRMNGFTGLMDLSRQNIRGSRLLAAGLQEEVEMCRAEAGGRFCEDHNALSRRNIRGCRELAIDLQEEIELRRGPQG